MELNEAVAAAIQAKNKLLEPAAVSDPRYMSEWMMRLAQYNSAVETHYASYKKRYELEMGRLLTRYMMTEGLKPTTAEKRVRIDIAETKANLEYLGAFTKANWSMISTIQSRYNHLQKVNVGQT
jgi:hypothetical protein